MYADPDDIIPTPQLPPCKYDEGEHHVNVPVQETVKVSVHGCSMSILASNAVYAMFEAYIHECPYLMYTHCSHWQLVNLHAYLVRVCVHACFPLLTYVSSL